MRPVPGVTLIYALRIKSKCSSTLHKARCMFVSSSPPKALLVIVFFSECLWCLVPVVNRRNHLKCTFRRNIVFTILCTFKLKRKMASTFFPSNTDRFMLKNTWKFFWIQLLDYNKCMITIKVRHRQHLTSQRCLIPKCFSHSVVLRQWLFEKQCRHRFPRPCWSKYG